MLVQGSSLPWMARLLRVEVPADPAPLDLRPVLATEHQQFALMQFKVAAEAPVIGYGFDILKPAGDSHPEDNADRDRRGGAGASRRHRQSGHGTNWKMK